MQSPTTHFKKATMKFLWLIPYTDLRDERARVEVIAFEAESEAAAKTYAEQVRRHWNAILDLVVEDRDQHPELAVLDGPNLLAEYGVRVGDVEVWTTEKLVALLPDLSGRPQREVA